MQRRIKCLMVKKHANMLLSIILATLLFLSLALAGCSNSSDKDRASEAYLNRYPSRTYENKSTVWPKNDLGMTYGSGLDAVSPEDEPDLIRVLATNGKVGYAYRTDLEGPEPSSPAAAIAQQKARGDKPRVIPVYEVDGVTQIGVFLSENNGNTQLIK